MLGVSQREFSKMIGVSYRQAYKYEHGINHISASILYEIAKTLRVSVDYFFQPLGGSSGDQRWLLAEMIRDFSAIKDERHQAAFTDLVRALANADRNDSPAE